ncbi:MAG TPA: MFS transporter, partial [Ornithinibacter sp.]|nr:MFS transporter [Ornithinibacter sp.]
MTAPPTDQLTTRSHRRAIAGAFAVQGLLFISLTLRLPQLKALFELSELELAALMLLLVVLAGVGSVAAELLARRRDSALALRVALGLVAVGVVVIGQAARGDGSLPLLV